MYYAKVHNCYYYHRIRRVSGFWLHRWSMGYDCTEKQIMTNILFRRSRVIFLSYVRLDRFSIGTTAGHTIKYNNIKVFCVQFLFVYYMRIFRLLARFFFYLVLRYRYVLFTLLDRQTCDVTQYLHYNNIIRKT